MFACPSMRNVTVFGCISKAVLIVLTNNCPSWDINPSQNAPKATSNCKSQNAVKK